jgi:creatinine amidohydrolase/Fe(II)-dependent formamide hydrolase-like protein
VLARLKERGIHQEAPAVAHLAHLLARRGELDGSAIGRVRAAPHPEITRLRIDAERSPITTMPADLRKPVLEILAQHTDGVMRRSGRQWMPVDLAAALRDGGTEGAPGRATRPVQAARRSKTAAGSVRASGRRAAAAALPSRAEEMGEILVAHMTWEQARDRFAAAEIALLPVGSTEQHGPHLSLDTDSFDAEYLAIEAARRVRSPRPLVFPTIPYGVAYHHMDFPGTLAVSPDVLSRMVVEVGVSAARHGITKLVIVNGHGGNLPALRYAAQIINRDARIFTCVESGETSDAEVRALIETPNDVHSGEFETSTSLATRPHLVRTDRLRRSVPSFASKYLDFTSRNSVEWYARTTRFSESGVMGDPTRASREKGERLWAIMIDHLTAFLEDLKRLRLDGHRGRRNE